MMRLMDKCGGRLDQHSHPYQSVLDGSVVVPELHRGICRPDISRSQAAATIRDPGNQRAWPACEAGFVI
jgi:hypothetical protein